MGFTSKVYFCILKCIRPMMIKGKFDNVNLYFSQHSNSNHLTELLNASKTYGLMKAKKQFNGIQCIHSQIKI